MKKFTKTLLSTALLASMPFALAQPVDKAQIQEIVREYLIQKPEVIVEALQNYQRKQYEQAQQTMKKTQQDAGRFAGQLFHQANDPVIGNPQGKITVVEFFDYQCPHCADMAPVIVDILKANPDLRIVFKEFPIRGALSEFAARAALAANKQGKYAVFQHELLSVKEPLTEALILKKAGDVGLNVDQLKKDMNDPSIQNQLKANNKLAQDLQLFGTPAFFIGKTETTANNGTIIYIPGQMNQKQMQDEINKVK
jgi:protein-disulfide isomerase